MVPHWDLGFTDSTRLAPVSSSDPPVCASPRQHFMWVPGINLRYSRLRGKYFTCWTTSPHPALHSEVVSRLALNFLSSCLPRFTLLCPALFQVFLWAYVCGCFFFYALRWFSLFVFMFDFRNCIFNFPRLPSCSFPWHSALVMKATSDCSNSIFFCPLRLTEWTPASVFLFSGLSSIALIAFHSQLVIPVILYLMLKARAKAKFLGWTVWGLFLNLA